MAGHSKWANIQHRKKKQDKKRGKIFTKLIREVTVAARAGGGDPNANPRLRLAIDKANAANMPKDTVAKAIKRGTGNLDGVTYEEARYEGYGPAGVAVMVDCLTDNRNRTVAEVRHAFSKCGGNLGTDGSVAYLFSQQGEITLAKGSNEDKVMELALESGAEDIVNDGHGALDVITSFENFETVKRALEKAELKLASAEITMATSTNVELDKDQAEKLLRLVDMLEDLDDVQEVYTNADISDEVLLELS
ncbi:MAG: YebC/PmpR family DNA-binding transcriptional regulator [Gammaproteobacteria bacterium]